VAALAGVTDASEIHAQTAGPFHLEESSIDEVQNALRSNKITCRALVQLYLRRIDAYDKNGPSLNAVQTVNPHALQEAERLDSAFRSSGPVGVLHCIPVLIKDQLDTSDMETTYGSAVFKGFVPKRDATVVAKLRKAGAVIIGKATMGEFASGYAGSASGPIRNPYDPRRHASGSSGGTGAGIAANFATTGIGEDTGGSIRGPAAVTSLVGLRPTVALVSRHGLFPARPTIDTVGPIARTVKDAAIILDVIAGYDPNDPVTAYAVGHIPTSFVSILTRDGLKSARIGVIQQAMDDRTDPASEDYKKVHAVIERAIGELKTLVGAELVAPLTIPNLPERLNKIYDGNVFETEAAVDAYLSQHANAPVKTLRAILLSGKVLPSRARVLMNSVGRSTDDEGYVQVQRLVENTRQVVLALMAEHELDALVYATSDLPPSLIAPDVMTNPVVDDTRLGSNRRLAAILGFPAITVPAGFTIDGLPVGLEFMARPFADATLLRFGYAYEQATHHRKPPAITPVLRREP
jgi:Asp-tRNA(Asn)/Glu-tRNA(Gln) amidotransferase A subunit family amidase